MKSVLFITSSTQELEMPEDLHKSFKFPVMLMSVYFIVLPESDSSLLMYH